jgi:AraC-like DNA-binding protein
LNTTPLEYLTHLVMDRARALIRQGVAIAEVANKVGYDSGISFTRAFGRVTGQTPGTYKRDGGREIKRERGNAALPG